MEKQRWRQVEQIYHSAKKRDAAQRGAFLAEACRGDDELRHEIDSLLALDTERECILDRPVIELLCDTAGGRAEPDLCGPFVPGTLLAGRFRIVRTAGSGGMGFVYEARDEQLDQRVALKCAKSGYGDRLPPEVRAAREVSHFNVCKVHDLHVASTPLGKMEFLSMEFIDGQTLSQRLDREGPVPEREAREIARQICAGLAQAHRQEVIHGDLKPGNIILTPASRNALRVVITDFGIATMKPVEGAPGTRGQGGTPDFMAPELFLGGRSTVASDLYALGVLFHVMLTGHAPKRSVAAAASTLSESRDADSQAATMTAGPAIVAADWRRSIDGLSPPWSGVAGRCMAPRPEDRYGSAEAVSDALRPRRLLLKGSALAAGVAALAFAYWQWGAEPAGPPVRLAVLPFSVEGDPVPGAGGIGMDVAARLSGARRNFTVITPREAERAGVETPVSARNVVGATHALETHLRHSGASIVATAAVTDLASGRTLGQPLHGAYAAGDSATLAKAILATVTGAFELRSGVPKESVTGAAYPYYTQGIELLRQDHPNFDQAIQDFAHAAALDPRSALPYAGLADAQMRNFDQREDPQWLKQAEDSVAKAQAINADSVPVLLVSGRLQETHGAYEPALRAFTRATQLDPNNPETWRKLAGEYDKTNRTDEAIATYRRAMKAQPNYYGIYMSLGSLYWSHADFGQAEELYRQVTTIGPGLSSGHMDLGLALLWEGRFQEAEASLQRGLALQRSPLGLVIMGGLYYEQERYAEAARYFEESVVPGKLAIGYKDLGDAYRHLGRDREARQNYLLARDMTEDEVARNPRQAESRVMLAQVSALLGDSHAAGFEAAQALSSQPENAIVRREFVIMCEVLHRREESLRLLQHAPAGLLSELSRQPDVKDLRRDPRFQELLRAKGTP